jgi:hypothetical protein
MDGERLRRQSRRSNRVLENARDGYVKGSDAEPRRGRKPPSQGAWRELEAKPAERVEEHKPPEWGERRWRPSGRDGRDC